MPKPSSIVRLPALLICLVVFSYDAVSQRQRRPLPVPEVLSTLSFAGRTPIDLSPDGQWVAYTVQDPRKSQPFNETLYLRITRTGGSPLLRGCDVWITNTQSRQTINLTEGRGTSWSPVWSPDGQYLAFYSDRNGRANVWLWEKSSRSLRLVSREVVRSFDGFESLVWTPDSKHIIAKVVPRGMTVDTLATLIEGDVAREVPAKSNELTVTVFRSIPGRASADVTQLQNRRKPTDATNTYLADVVLIDVTNGTIKRLVSKKKVIGIWLSPDAAQLAFTVVDQIGSDTASFDLSVVSLRDASLRVLAGAVPTTMGLSVSWSPDGKSLSYISRNGDCFVVQLRDGIIRNVTQSSHPSFNTLYRAPVWDHTGKAIYLLTLDALWRVSIPEGALTELARIPDKQLLEIVSARSGRFWSPDSGRSMYILTRDQETKKTAFYKVNLTTGKSASLLEEEKFCSYDPIFAIDASDTGTRFVYLIEDVQHPAEIWIADADVPNPRRLTEINPKLDSYEMGTSRLIEWTTAAGQKLRGALLLPAGYEPGRRYPMIVAVYGGNYLSNYVYQFGLTQGSLDNMQLFATRGYAVLLPDAPLRVGTPMNDIANTILPGVDKVVELGIADPKSIGLRGNSYGGYTVLALLVQTPRFKAAVVSAAQGNLIGKYDSLTGERALGIEWAERGQGRMGGSPWEYRDRYIQNSPVFFFDKVETPLLVLHGSRDIGVPVFLAEELFVSLRRLGKEVELARYEGESHVIMGYRNRLDYLERMIEWFDSKLKPLDSRIPKSGIPDPKLQ